MRTNEVYAGARLLFSARSRWTCPHKCGPLLSRLCLARFCLSFLTFVGGGLFSESVSKADFLPDHFDSKQSRDHIVPGSYIPGSIPVSQHLYSHLVRLGDWCWRIPLGALTLYACFLHFLRTADILAPRLNVVFLRLLRLISLVACWRLDDVTLIPNYPPSSTGAHYRPIYTTPVLS